MYKYSSITDYIIVVTFHSIEDKIVKFFFQKIIQKKKILLDIYQNQKILIKFLNYTTKKQFYLQKMKLKKNPSSRSAKLRYARKIKDDGNFEDFFLKFKKFFRYRRYRKKNMLRKIFILNYININYFNNFYKKLHQKIR